MPLLLFGVIGLLLVAVPALGIASSSRARWKVLDAYRWLESAGASRRAGPALLGLAVLCGAVSSFVYWLVLEDGDWIEPFRFFEGTSMWPAELVRMAAGVLALGFLFATACRIDACTGKLAKVYLALEGDLLRPTLRDLLGWEAIRKACAGRWRHPERVDFSVFTESFIFQRSPWSQLVRVGTVFVPYMALGIAVILSFGVPNRPYRGRAVWWVDTLLVPVCVVLVIVLILWIADATRQCDKYTRVLSARKSTGWPAATLERFEAELSASPDMRSSVACWIDIQMTREWTAAIAPLIYGPFVLIILMIIARSRLFDGFDMPMGLVGVIVIALLYASVSIYMLRRAAEEGRRAAVSELTQRRIFLCADASKKAQAEQIGHMVTEIAALKDGAYGPLIQQDLVRAITVLVGSAGGWSVIEFFILGR